MPLTILLTEINAEYAVVIVAADGSFSTPIGCAVASRKATLTYIKLNGTTATSADIGKATSV